MYFLMYKRTKVLVL